ncbi:hypothetical protein SDC9_148549 [bioreactor metagenome]|uniref:Uncharacterized protein n=1 Tax=bioreactor metagenome TaxID=1076179 RepID=A0A645EJ33_9ZZZZ
MLISARPPQCPVGGDQLHFPDGTDRQAMGACVERHAAPQRVAGDRDVSGTPVQCRQSVRCRRGDHVVPDGTSQHPRCTADRVDRHTAQTRQDDQDGIRQIGLGQCGGRVPGGLRSDAQAGSGSRADDVDDVFGGDRPRHGIGTLIGGEVPGHAGCVVARISGQDDAVSQRVAKVVGPAVDCRVLHGHEVFSLSRQVLDQHCLTQLCGAGSADNIPVSRGFCRSQIPGMG